MEHKHAELIHAWADGAEIEEWIEDDWFDNPYPTWFKHNKYRIKPKEHVKRWIWVYKFSDFDWGLVNELLSDDEAAIRKANNPQNKYRKLPWTEMEFEE